MVGVRNNLVTINRGFFYQGHYNYVVLFSIRKKNLMSEGEFFKRNKPVFGKFNEGDEKTAQHMA